MPCGGVSLFTLTETKIKDLINLSKDLILKPQQVGKSQLRMSWFKMDDYTDKTLNLFTFYFDNLKFWLILLPNWPFKFTFEFLS